MGRIITIPMIGAVAMLLLIVGVVVAPAPPPAFFASVIESIPENYVVASLADLNTSKFATSYRFPGINFLNSIPWTPCCVVSVAEGYLSYGPTDTDSNFIQPYFHTDGSSACVSGTEPRGTAFGISSSSPGPLNGTLLYPVYNQTEFRFVATATPTTSPSYGNCTASTPTSSSIALVKVQYRYIVLPNSPAPPPSSGYTIATLKDVQSAEFAYAYNYNHASLQLTVETSQESNFCCMLRVAEGWLGYGNFTSDEYSPVTLYNSETTWMCTSLAGSAWGQLGTAFGGPNSATIFWSMNGTIASQFGTFTKNPENWSYCGANGLANSLAVYKRAN
ncbi:membrane-associated protein, putative [Bodo saltans]|uniref:Membrane-associated protein, putative n=1 Tax=Bodo saltans TaxID=75058 RepID=A0A0S4JI57_BODSA|nr:membrane-associated protein, putative [Bodo saltans]|eukprot:CUG91182.1 membrane-associated protein, putative [Bodo saltans]